MHLNSVSIKPFINVAGQPKLTQDRLREIEIPLPSSDKADDIVFKLDAMQSLIDSIKAERDTRQKQYEYYRDQIFDFFQKEA